MKLGSLRGKYDMAVLFQYGKGVVPRDIRKAVAFIKELVAAEYPDALYTMGTFCFMRVQGKKDLRMAFDLIRRAADAGVTEAEYNLGNFYHRGLEGAVEANVDLAKEWYEKAHAKGFVHATHNLGVIYDHDKSESSPTVIKTAAEESRLQETYRNKVIAPLAIAGQAGHPDAAGFLQ